MDLTEFYGVPMAFVDPDEALRTDWSAYRGRVDVVRVDPAPEDRWPELRAAGFVPKPKMVTWMAGTAGDDGSFLAALGRKERQTIRSARRALEAEGLKIEMRPVDEWLMAEFLALYRQRVAEMKHGWAVADEQRDAVLSDAKAYFAVCVYRGAALNGCALVRLDAETGRARIRFSAVDSRRRQSSLARVLYLEAIRVARECGCSLVSLGTDPNLFGHIAKPGLLGFKGRLGFSARPAHLVDPGAGNDQADLLIGLSQLTDPAMVLGYIDETPTDRLRLEVFTWETGLDLRPYEASFLAGCRVHAPGQGLEALQTPESFGSQQHHPAAARPQGPGGARR